MLCIQYINAAVRTNTHNRKPAHTQTLLRVLTDDVMGSLSHLYNMRNSEGDTDKACKKYSPKGIEPRRNTRQHSVAV